MNLLKTVFSEPVVAALGLSLVHFLWQGLVLWLCCAGLMRLLRNYSPQLRYLVSVLTLAAMAVAPVVTFVVILGSASASPEPIGGAAVQWLGASAVATVSAAAAPGSAWLVVSYWVVALWLAGVVIVGSRVVSDGYYLKRLRATADYAGAGDWQRRLVEIGVRMGIGISRMRLALSDRVASPVVTGLFRPVILLPTSVLTRLPAEQIEAILAHELAHIHRRDHWVNLFQVVVETLLFYHPAVAWVSRNIRTEREHCADDMALGVVPSRMIYARTLATLEQERGEVLALTVGVTDGDFSRRIRRLFARPAPDQRGIVGLATALLLMVAGAVGTVVLFGPGADEAPSEPAPVSVPEPLAHVPLIEPAGDRSAETPAGNEVVAGPDAGFEPVAEPSPVAETGLPAAEPVAESPPAGPDTRQQDAPETPPATEPVQELAAAEPEVGGMPAPAPVEDSAVAQSPAGDGSPLPESAPDRRPDSVLGPDAESLDPAAEWLAPTAESLAYVPPQTSREPEAEPVLAGGRPLQSPGPAYPRHLFRRNIEGEVRLAYTVDAQGRVGEIEVLDSTPGTAAFEESSIAALSQWRFEPFTLDGRPVDKRLEVTIEFSTEVEVPCSVTGTRVNRC